MTRVLVVADSGSTMAAVSEAVVAVRGAHIVRHGSDRAPLDRLVSAVAPDLVVIGNPETSERALARVSEVRDAAPDAKVVVFSSRARAGVLRTQLRGLTVTVLSGDMEPHRLGLALSDVLAESDGAVPAVRAISSRRIPRAAGERRHRGRRRARTEPVSHGGSAA
jgi:chemotaxis response regulator CheB